MTAGDDPLSFLLKLNGTLAEREAANLPVTGPGLPPCVSDAAPFVSDDCIRMPD